jgi:hypothetical protein
MNIARLSVGKIMHNIELNWLERMIFYFGTIEPDLSITQFIHPHFYVKSAKYIYLKIKKLQERESMGIISAFELGRIVHYLSDFCCHVHCSGGIGNVNEHIIYERNINKYLIRNFNKISGRIMCGLTNIQGYDNMISFIEATIEEYKTTNPSFFNDIEKSTEICTALLSGLYSSNSAILNNSVMNMEMKMAS